MTDLPIYFSGSMQFEVADPAALVNAVDLVDATEYTPFTTAQMARLTPSSLDNGDPFVRDQVRRALTKALLDYLSDICRPENRPAGTRSRLDLLNRSVTKPYTTITSHEVAFDAIVRMVNGHLDSGVGVYLSLPTVGIAHAISRTSWVGPEHVKIEFVEPDVRPRYVGRSESMGIQVLKF